MKSTVILALVAFLAIPSFGQSLRVGAAKRVITPEPLLPVSGGIGTPQPVTQKMGELWARAMVLEKGETRVAIVNIDNLGWPAILGDRSRALIKGIPGENVLIGATHTHSGPDAYAFFDGKGGLTADTAYLSRCVAMIAEAVNEAVENLKAAQLRVAHEEIAERIAYNYYAPQLYDRRCGVIQAADSEGEVIATLVNYAVHPEVLGNGRSILSPDMCGPLYDRIEEKAGGIALFMNGAQGGMVTADNRDEEGKSIGTWDECVRIGHLLAEEALRIIDDEPWQADPVLHSTSKVVEFPITSPMMQGLLEYSLMGSYYPKKDTAHTTLNLVNIGSAQVLTIPGEALPNIGFYLKRNMPTKHPFLFGLTNDAFGYMLTKEDFNSFKRYDYVSRTSLGEMTAEIYIEEVLKLVDSSPKPNTQ